MVDDVWFNPPVPVRTKHVGRTYNVSSARAAAEQLMLWETRGPKWRKAVQTCLSALEGKTPAADVRKAFEAAARESGMLRGG